MSISYSLKKPSEKKTEELAKELHEYPELKPRLTFPFLLNENRKNALEMIQADKLGEKDEEKIIKLLESDDFIERRTGVFLLGEIPKISEKNQDRALLILKRIDNDEDPYLREMTAQALGGLGEKVLPILEGMNKDRDFYVQRAAMQAKIKIIIDTHAHREREREREGLLDFRRNE